MSSSPNINGSSNTTAVGAVERMASYGDATALICAGLEVSYAALYARVLDRARELGCERTLVLLAGGNDIELVVTYLAALDAGHPVWLAPAHERLARVSSLFRPGVVVRTDESGFTIDHRSDRARDLHPSLGLLLSTSGSTGSSKLVRLSHTNVSSNADAIAGYLQLTPADRAITSLPLHYCYGLSVLNSHLAVGASVVLTATSVVDPCFWADVDRYAVTNLAGVSHTFDLLETAEFFDRSVPSLRFITQAGGRLDPERVRRYAQLGRDAGWRFYTMYGQTEATARMAYLPPEDAAEHPSAVGVAIPGGSFRLVQQNDESGVGEIVYSGPNVMLGYAESVDDLALGRVIEELHTGDLGRFDDQGLLHVVGRASRFIKPFGLRIDLDAVEASLASEGVTAYCGGDDSRLDILAAEPATEAHVRDALASSVALPPHAICVVVVPALPMLANGKPDRVAAAAWCAAAGSRSRRPTRRGRAETPRSAFEAVLGDRVDERKSFVDMGGDSLSYVETSTRLEEALGFVPKDWHVTPLAALAALPSRKVRWARVETSVMLRAVAIVLIVGTHMHAFRVPGGAHVLLAVAGFNFARFQLSGASAGERVRAVLATVSRVAAPTALWIGAQMALVGGYSLGTLLLVNNYTGSSWRRDGRWQFWYFEALVQLFLVFAALIAIPAVSRAERRRPFLFVLGLLGMALLLRFEVLQFGDPYNYLYRTHTVAWFFLIGWAAQRSTVVWQRFLVSAVALVSVHGFFDYDQRNVAVMIGVLLIVWVPLLAMPRPAARAVATVAAASMIIFLVHWRVWPPLDRMLEREIALPLTIGVGVVASLLFNALVRSANRWLRVRRPALGRCLRVGRLVRLVAERRRVESAPSGQPAPG